MGSMDMKSFIRHMEDQQEIINLLKFDREVATRDHNRLNEMAEVEVNHNVRLKQILQQVKDLNEAETKKRNSVSAIRFGFMKGTMTKLLYFSEGQVAQIKRVLDTKKTDLVNKLNMYIENYAKSRPLVVEFHQKETLFERLQYEKTHLVAELETVRKAFHDEMQIAEILFQQNVVEMASHVLRYNDIINGKKKPSKSTQSKLMAMKAMRQSLKPSSTVSKQSRIEGNSGMMQPTTIATSKCQSIDTNEVAGTEAFVRGSISRTAVRVTKTDGNKRRLDEELSKPQKFRKPSTAQEKAAPEQAKKVVSPQLSKKSERPEQFKKNVISEPTKKIMTPKQTVSIAPQSQRKNITPAELSKKLTPPAQIKKNVSVPSSLKATTDSANSSQKSKSANVTFANFPPPGSAFGVSFSQGREVSSSGFDIALEDDEMDHQMDDDDEMDRQMDDDDEMDPQMDGDDEMDAPLDDDGNDLDNCEFDDNIPGWTSPNPSSGNNNANIGSPASKAPSDLDPMFFNRGDADAEPMGDDNFAALQRQLGDEMEEFLKNFQSV